MSEQPIPFAGASRKVWGLLSLTVFLLILVTGGARAQEDPSGPPIPPVEILTQAPVPGGVNTVIQISVSKDAYISSAHPSTNYGALTTTKIGYEVGGDGAMRIVLQFDLSSVPQNATINSAQFKYYLVESKPPSDTPMGFLAQFMKATWSEYGVTWNNASYLGGTPLPIGEVPGSPGWYASDGTAAVQAWHSGTQTNYGVLITGDEGPERNRSRIFYSREKIGYSPVLIVDYTLSCDTLPPVATVSPLPAYSPGSFQVKWSGTDSAPTGCTPTGIAYYDVEYRVNGGAWVTWKSQTTETSGTIQSGANGSLYEFRARAVDKAGNVQGFSAAQASTRVDTVPPNAEVLDLNNYTFGSAFFVQWVGNDNLSGIASYDVQWRTTSGNWQTLIENTTQTSFQFTGGQNNVTYQFRARARDTVGNVQPFPDQAQAQTTVFTHPTATVQPFDPPILKPTAPITDTFMVNWTVDAGPTTVTETRIYYQYKLGEWKLWDIFPYPQLSAPFPWEQLGLGDGPYAFEAIALNTLGQVEPLSGQPEAIILVDMADLISPRAYLPIQSR